MRRKKWGGLPWFNQFRNGDTHGLYNILNTPNEGSENEDPGPKTAASGRYHEEEDSVSIYNYKHLNLGRAPNNHRQQSPQLQQTFPELILEPREEKTTFYKSNWKVQSPSLSQKNQTAY